MKRKAADPLMVAKSFAAWTASLSSSASKKISRAGFPTTLRSMLMSSPGCLAPAMAREAMTSCSVRATAEAGRTEEKGNDKFGPAEAGAEGAGAGSA